MKFNVFERSKMEYTAQELEFNKKLIYVILFYVNCKL